MFYIISIIVYIVSFLIISPNEKLAEKTKLVLVFAVLPILSFLVAGIICVVLGIEIVKP